MKTKEVILDAIKPKGKSAAYLGAYQNTKSMQ